MNHDLKKITESILSSKTIQEEVAATTTLSTFYLDLLETLEIQANSKVSTTVNGGVALSPKHAMDCLTDGVRTARFLKGIFSAITSKLEEKEAPIEIIYAGTGPLGTLLIPMLPLFLPNKIQATLIDIHKTSVQSCEGIVSHLGLSSFIKAFVVCDALTYNHGAKVDIVITETMDKALTVEPQVILSEYLSQQLKETGILIPESISISTNVASLAAQPSVKQSLFEERETEKIGTATPLFKVNKTSTISTKGFVSDSFISPVNLDSPQEVCVFTEIRTFGEHKLSAGDCFITDPICLIATNSFESNTYQLQYEVSPKPKWTVKQKNGTD